LGIATVSRRSIVRAHVKTSRENLRKPTGAASVTRARTNGVPDPGSRPPRDRRSPGGGSGYDWNQWITDGFRPARRSREFMAPAVPRRDGFGPPVSSRGPRRIIGRDSRRGRGRSRSRNVPRRRGQVRPIGRRRACRSGPIVLIFNRFSRCSSRSGRGGGAAVPRYWGGGPWSGLVERASETVSAVGWS